MAYFEGEKSLVINRELHPREKGEIGSVRNRKAWIGEDVILDRGMLFPPSVDGKPDTLFFPIKASTLFRSIEHKIDGEIPPLGVYIRSRIAQAQIDGGKPTDNTQTTSDLITEAVRTYVQTEEDSVIKLPLKNDSLNHHVLLSKGIGVLQLYYWPERFLKGQELLDRIRRGEIIISGGAYEWLYGSPESTRDQDIVGIRFAHSGNRQRIKPVPEIDGISALPADWGSILVVNGLSGTVYDYRASIERQKEQVPQDLPDIPFPWVDRTEARITLNGIHALIVDPDHSASRFMKGGRDSGGRPETDWQLIGEYLTTPSTMRNTMDLIFAEAA